MFKNNLILLVLLSVFVGCEEKFVLNIPDDFYTIETNIFNLSPVRTIQFDHQFSEYYNSAGGRSISYFLSNKPDINENCDMIISFPLEDYDYYIFVKSFGNKYKSFLYKQKSFSSSDQIKYESVVYTSVDSIQFNKVFGSNYSIKIYNVNNITLDFSKDIENLDFFKEIQLN